MSRLAGHFRIALYAAIIVSVVFLYASRPSSPPHRVSNAQATTPIALLFTLSHASSSRPDLVRQLTAQVRSIMQHSKSEALLHLYLIGDDADYRLAADAIHSVVQHSPHSINLTIQPRQIRVEDALSVQLVNSSTRRLFTRPNSYYDDPLFFLSLSAHLFMPPDVDRVVMLDVDLKHSGDTAELYRMFDEFSQSHLVGIAYEQQPTYRYMFRAYREANPHTAIGEQPPNGFPGFNSGVMLLELARIRNVADEWRRWTSFEYLNKSAALYSLVGSLGDQDIFTLIKLERPELFFRLPCQWNRQLCTKWRNYDGDDQALFDAYHRCDAESIRVWHGNCKTDMDNATSVLRAL